MNDLNSKFDYLVQLTLDTRAEQKQAQAEQKQAQAEQKQAQAEQKQAQVELEARLMAEFSTVKNKLTKIEANTVTIMGMMIQDFDNISPEIHAEIEAASEEISASEETVAFIAAVKEGTTTVNHKGRTVKTRKSNNQANTATILGKDNVTTVKECISNLNLENYKDMPHLIPMGDWISGICNKAFGFRFGGQYPIRFAPLIEAFINYYSFDRTNTRKT